jgi:hypothetical protein
MIYRPRRNYGHAEWLIEKQMRAAEAHKTHWLIQAQASLERSLRNIRSPDEWEGEFCKQLDKDLRNAVSLPEETRATVHEEARRDCAMRSPNFLRVRFET